MILQTSSEEKKERRRSEEHTSELQSQSNLVCPLLLEKKNIMSYVRGVTHPHLGRDGAFLQRLRMRPRVQFGRFPECVVFHCDEQVSVACLVVLHGELL